MESIQNLSWMDISFTLEKNDISLLQQLTKELQGYED